MDKAHASQHRMEWLEEGERGKETHIESERAIAGETLVHTARYVPAVWRMWLRCWAGRGRGHIGEDNSARGSDSHGHIKRQRQVERDQSIGRK